jgi:hypothetical protein
MRRRGGASARRIPAAGAAGNPELIGGRGRVWACRGRCPDGPQVLFA